MSNPQPGLEITAIGDRVYVRYWAAGQTPPEPPLNFGAGSAPKAAKIAEDLRKVLPDELRKKITAGNMQGLTQVDVVRAYDNVSGRPRV